MGKDAVIHEAMHDLAPELVQKAIEEEGLEAIDTPEVDVDTGDTMVIKATVPLPPTVELGDYKSIRVSQDPVEVKPEQVEEAMESVRTRNAPWEQVDRPVEYGDLLTIDVDGKVDGKSVINETGASYSPDPNIDFPVPGFSPMLEGMGKGESKEFNLTLPDSFREAEIAGKECSFAVTVQEVKAKLPAPLDDDFVKSLDEEYETLGGLQGEDDGGNGRARAGVVGPQVRGRPHGGPERQCHNRGSSDSHGKRNRPHNNGRGPGAGAKRPAVRKLSESHR